MARLRDDLKRPHVLGRDRPDLPQRLDRFERHLLVAKDGLQQALVHRPCLPERLDVLNGEQLDAFHLDQRIKVHLLLPREDVELRDVQLRLDGERLERVGDALRDVALRSAAGAGQDRMDRDLLLHDVRQRRRDRGVHPPDLADRVGVTKHLVPLQRKRGTGCSDQANHENQHLPHDPCSSETPEPDTAREPPAPASPGDATPVRAIRPIHRTNPRPTTIRGARTIDQNRMLSLSSSIFS